MTVNIYLFFNGNCEEAMNFYKDATGGSIAFVTRYGESPLPCKDEEKNLIMHATMNINGANVMFSDAGGGRVVTIGSNFCISLDYSGDTDIQAQFDALSAGGEVTMPLQETYWAAKFGMCTDKFGIKWMFNLSKPQPAND